MHQIAIVILNYLNYKDTIECIDSIFEMEYDTKGIVIVDNHSDNESLAVLRKKYSNEKLVHIIKNNKNDGFAKGNNVGIQYARSVLKTDFVLVVNNDTIFKDKAYLEKLLNLYHPGIGIMGSDIICSNGFLLQRKSDYFSLKEAIVTYFSLLLLLMNQRHLIKYLPKLNKKNRVKILQGCVLLFTPDYFQYYNGFYKRTFLYYEEQILYLMCKSVGLEQLYVNNAEIYHKEGQSSELSFNNENRKKYYYYLKSYKYVIFWIIKEKMYNYDYNLWGRCLWKKRKNRTKSTGKKC